MIEVIGVSFKKGGRIYYFDPNKLKLKTEDNVIVETDRGLQFATVVSSKFEISKSKFGTNLKKVIKLCDKKDIQTNFNNVKEAKKALIKCKELIKKYDLNMIVLDANYTFDRQQLLISFLADNRVDFRKLAKDLAIIYKTRIELRQVGVRDKAKEIGGYGSCGMQLCCSKFLDDFDSVSINMAKDQNIALNPNKINGICGRLLCCLKYENDYYKECNKKLPKVGKKVQTEYGEGKVISIEPLKMKYKISTKEKGIVDISINESN